MPAQPPKEVIIPFKNLGIISKIDSRAIPPGSFQYLSNIISEVEGSITVRRGRKYLGGNNNNTISPVTFLHKSNIGVQEVPGTPSGNPRYLQQGPNIIRSNNYANASYATVANNVCVDPVVGESGLWTAVDYAAGGTGNPYTFFACQNNMLKDNGLGLLTPLQNWGIPAAAGVAQATSTFVISSFNANSAVISAPNNLIANQQVMFSTPSNLGLPANLNPANTYYVLATGLNSTQFEVSATSGGSAIVVGAGGSNNNVLVGMVGNLSGGANGSPSGSLPYSYIYTWKSNNTLNEGNPSQFMVADSQIPNGQPVACNNNGVVVTVYGCYNNSAAYWPEIEGNQSIAVYRAGGTFADGLYRLVGYTANPGGATSTTFFDNAADLSIAEAPQAFFDNGQPVISSLRSPLVTTFANNSGPGFGNWAFNNTAGWTLGSTITIAANATTGTNPESCVISSVGPGNNADLTLQYAHSPGDSVTLSVVYGQACTLSCTAFDAVFLAGDPNNPQTLYMSKTGLPESFPVIDALGNSHSINVGTPANPIVAICEFRGNIICLNSQNIFEVPVFDGVMYAPNVSPAQRGLIAPKAWCLVDNELWYLAYDGIYSWDGGQSVKRTEAIDQLFHGISTTAAPADGGPTPVGIYLPVDYGQTNPNALQFIRMEYYRNQVHFLYLDTAGSMHDLYYDLVQKRWLPNDKSFGNINPNKQTSIYLERDIGNLIYVRTANHNSLNNTFGTGFQVCVDDVLDNNGYTVDEWTTSGNNGTTITSQAVTGWIDCGNEYAPKVFDELWLDVDVEPANASLAVNTYYDYQLGVGIDSFSVSTSTSGRQWVGLALNAQQDNSTVGGGNYTGFGRQASVMAVYFDILAANNSGLRSTIYGMKVRYRDLPDLTAAPYYDWSDCGHKWDKRFSELTVEFDTNVWSYNNNAANATAYSHTLIMDTLTGVTGNNVNLGVQSFIITNNNTTPLSPSRGLVTFPILDNISGNNNNVINVAKMVRLRAIPTFVSANNATSPTTDYFRILAVDWKKDDLPPDIVPFSEWQDNGSPYLKYANQLLMEIDTGGVPCALTIQADGNTTQTFSGNNAITTTYGNRDVALTLLPNQMGRKWRWLATPGNNGKAQVYSSKFLLQPADKGEVFISQDWDDLGHPYDKCLISCVLEYDTTISGNSVTLQLDTINGIGGTTLNSNVQQFVLPANVRGKSEFAITPANNSTVLQVAKLIRLYPVGSPADTPSHRQWKYSFQKVDYPSDFTTFTDYKIAQSDTDKEPSYLSVNMDTAGSTALVSLLNEDGTVQNYNHTGTFSDRIFNYGVPTDSHAKQWRLAIVPGNNGKTQLFDWGFQRWNPFPLSGPVYPPEVIYCTPWTNCGYEYTKAPRNLILDINTNNSNCTVYLNSQESGNVQTFTVNTGIGNRHVVLACNNTNSTGTLWRLIFAPGNNAYSQLWDWSLDTIREPAAVTYIDSLEQDFGFAGYKWLNQGFLDITGSANNQSVQLNILTDGGALFYSNNFAVGTTRTMQRFFLPMVSGNGVVLGKSKLYRFQMSSNTTFQLYSDSRFDWLPWLSDQRASFRGFKISSEEQVAAA